MKRFISVFLSLAMMLSMFTAMPLTAQAAARVGYGPTFYGITYYINTETGEAEVGGADSSITTTNIKSEVYGYKVTSIGYKAFSGCDSLTTVTIPNSVTSIGDDAFSGCTSLTTVTIPDSVTSIGEGAFCGCDSLATVTIPNSVTSIADCAFYWCSKLTSVTIPDSVTSIGNEAFGYYGDGYNAKNQKISQSTVTQALKQKLMPMKMDSHLFH